MNNRIVPLMVVALSGLSFASSPTVTSAEIKLPGDQPVFFMVTSLNEEGLVIERRPPPTKLVDVPPIIYKPAFKTLRATDATGKKLTAADVSRRLKRGSIVLVSPDDEPVDPVLLSVVKADTVVLLGVFPPKGATGAEVVAPSAGIK